MPSRISQEEAEALFLPNGRSVAEEVADRIGIVHMGKLVAVGTEEELHNLGGEGNAELEATFLALTREESDVAVQRQLHQG